MKVSFYFDDGILIKCVRSESDAPLEGYIWNVKKKEWVEAWEQTCGRFYGFDPAEKYTKERAKKYMIGYGATEKEAEEAVAGA